MNIPFLTLDMDAAVERMGDKEIYVEIAHCFAGNIEGSVASLQDALDAADMAASTRLSHSLKGNCATVGAEELRQACLLLEHTCRAEDAAEALRLFAELRPKLMALRGVLAAL